MKKTVDGAAMKTERSLKAYCSPVSVYGNTFSRYFNQAIQNRLDLQLESICDQIVTHVHSNYKDIGLEVFQYGLNPWVPIHFLFKFFDCLSKLDQLLFFR